MSRFTVPLQNYITVAYVILFYKPSVEETPVLQTSWRTALLLKNLPRTLILFLISISLKRNMINKIITQPYKETALQDQQHGFSLDLNKTVC